MTRLHLQKQLALHVATWMNDYAFLSVFPARP